MTMTQYIVTAVAGALVFAGWLAIGIVWPSTFATVMVGIVGVAFGAALVMPTCKRALDGWRETLDGWKQTLEDRS
jgi:xanthosine utilization system XapX-like protein